jgi:hypothetical protein
MRVLTLFFVFLSASVSLFAQTATPAGTPQPNSNLTSYTRPDAEARFKRYVKGTIGPTAFVAPVVSAGIRQWRDTPEEWGQGAKGYGRRFADAFGKQLIGNTITYGLDEALKLDSHFYKSEKRDFKSRFSNAVLSAVTARTKSGRRVIGVPKLVGTYSAAIIANETWRPNRYDYKDGLRDGSLSIATRIGVNLIREFVFK